MMALLLAATLTLPPPDSVRHSGAPRRVVEFPDSVEEDLRDRWLAEDKLKHFTMSYGITVFAYAGGRMLADHNTSSTLAVVAGGAAGVLKEIYDRTHDRPFSFRDLTWDIAGIAAGYVLIRNTR